MRVILSAAVFAAAISSSVIADDAVKDRNLGPKGDAVCVGHEANLDLYFKVLAEVFNKRDLTNVESYFAPEFKNHNAPSWAAQGPDAIRQYLPMLAGAFPDRAVVHEFVLCDGDYVIARTHVTGTSKGPYMGQPPTGKTYSVTGTDIYRAKNGKFTDRWGNEDALGMMQQLGYMPERGAAERGGAERGGAPAGVKPEEKK